MSNSFRAPASILQNARKRPFLYGRCHNFARDSCFAMNDILYARPISSLSNGVYLMSLRPSVAEQSVRDPSGDGRFSPFSIFPFPMLIHQFVALLGILRVTPPAKYGLGWCGLVAASRRIRSCRNGPEWPKLGGWETLAKPTGQPEGVRFAISGGTPQI